VNVLENDCTHFGKPQRQQVNVPRTNNMAIPSNDNDNWQTCLDKVSSSVVSLKINITRPYDGNGCSHTLATGFVVYLNGTEGLILTNRHVVTVGPIRGVATFGNHEEVPVFPIYRDPIHDFGFFKFDASRIRFMKVVPIVLDPSGAKVGTEVRVIGNDAGEKLSILSGTIARTDRDAPVYSATGYNDFNTFYISAASSTSGGSSGSPVLNLSGSAVAINAGGRVKEATSYYYPLDRIVRALDLIKQHGIEHASTVVTRGTIQTVFKYHPYDETRRLGLPVQLEEEIRTKNPEGTGMLVVEKIVPEGPGSVAGLQPGDILLSLNTELCTSFTVLEATMDQLIEEQGHGGGSLDLVVWRGAAKLHVAVAVEDLHQLVPVQLLEIGQSAFHTLSYHQAINFHVKCQGIFVAWAGYMLKRAGIPQHVVIDSIDNVPLTGITETMTLLNALPNQKSVPFRYRSLFNQHVQKVKLVKIDRTWFPMSMMKRNDTTGLWDEMPGVASTIPPKEKPQVQNTTFMRVPRYVWILLVGLFVRCSLFVVRCSLFVVRCSLFVVRCSLFFVLCALCFVLCALCFVLCCCSN